jgi:hypothetical protein
MKLRTILFTIAFLPMYSHGLDLQFGFKADDKIDLLKAIYARYQTLPGYLIENDVNKYYSLSTTGTAIGNYDLTNENNELKGWPLIRWQYQYFSPEVKAYYDELHSRYPLPFDYEGVGPGVGCIGDSPLRYGDLEADDNKEIIVILNGLFMVFSPKYSRVVFAEPLDESDWMTLEEMTQFFDGNPPGAAQYTSRFLAENGVIDAGIRAYAKLFLDDFDSDGHPDILVWRKSYRANATGDSLAGFTKLRDGYQHYERDLVAQAASDAGITGEYLPQETEEATVKQWLVSANLTWQKGYPSQSECPGEVGQLIPEMHDTLLNDPDVLQ